MLAAMGVLVGGEVMGGTEKRIGEVRAPGGGLISHFQFLEFQLLVL